MKIAYLLGSLNRGGTETLLLDVFRNAASNGLDAIGVYRKTGVYEQQFRECGVEMHLLTVGRNPLSYLFRLRKLLRSSDAEVVHAQQPLDALYARLACAGTGIKVIQTLHGYDYKESGISKRILNYIIHRTACNIYVSDTQRQYYQKKYGLKPAKQKVVYNGISFDKFDVTWLDTRCTASAHPMTSSHRMSEANGLRDELQLSADTLLFGTVGNFVPGRDQLAICRFLDLLNREGVDFHFVFVGKRSDALPHLYDECVKYCRANRLTDKVSFLGSRDDVPALLHQLDAFVYASDHDTFGIAMVEAMAASIPVFVNDWEVMTEITGNGRCATLYKSKDEADLQRVFLEFMQNKEAYQNKACEAAAFVRELYSIEKYISELKKVYGSL